MSVSLDEFCNDWYDPGKNIIVRFIWYFVNIFFFLNPLNPSTKLKVFLLRIFGSKVGDGVNIKPRVNVKYPWNIEIGNNSWIGEGVWLDSLEKICIANDVCVSQGVYFCTGNHDWSDRKFGLIVEPIMVETGVWIGTHSVILPGVTLAMCSVIKAGSTIAFDTEPYMIYGENNLKIKKKRIINIK